MKSILSFLRKYYSVLLTILILYLLIKSLAVKDINHITDYFSLKSLGIGLLIYFFIKLINTYRYKLFFHLTKFWKAFLILCFSNFMLNILPFRAGEISYIRLFKKHFGLDYDTSVSKLIVLRVMDYIAVLILFLFSTIYTGTEILKKLVDVHSLGKYLVLAVLIGIGCIVGLIFLFKYLLKKGNRFVEKIKNLFDRFLQNVKSLKSISLLILFGLSLAYWLMRILLGYAILIVLNIHPGFFIVMFISMILMVIDSLPFKTVAGFGLFEGGWLYLLTLWGYSGAETFIKILTFHILILVITTVWGVFGWGVLRRYKFTTI